MSLKGRLAITLAIWAFSPERSLLSLTSTVWKAGKPSTWGPLRVVRQQELLVFAAVLARASCVVMWSDALVAAQCLCAGVRHVAWQTAWHERGSVQFRKRKLHTVITTALLDLLHAHLHKVVTITHRPWLQ